MGNNFTNIKKQAITSHFTQKTTASDVGELCAGLGQVQQCGEENQLMLFQIPCLINNRISNGNTVHKPTIKTCITWLSPNKTTHYYNNE